MQKKLKYGITIVALLLLGCRAGTEKSADEPQWTVDACLESDGLFIETKPPKCFVDGKEQSLDGTSILPEVELGYVDWSDEPFFKVLRSMGEPLDFVWDVEKPLIGQYGKSAVIEGEIVFFFRYSTAEEAVQERQNLEENEQAIDGSFVRWGDEVHYAQIDAVVAVYVGSNEEIIKLLGDAERSVH